MTPEFLELISRFDSAFGRWQVPPPPRPTSFSIERINQHFDLTLPESLIAFAGNSKCFGVWFASIGPDYDSHSHIMRINSYWRRRRHTRVIPKNLVAINLGHDEDMICIDRSKFDAVTGEYAVGYWSPGVEPVPLAPDFPSYVREMVRNRG